MNESVEEVLINNVSRDEILRALNSMTHNPIYQTKTPFHSHHKVSFVDHHLNYLKGHPSLNPHHYLANLKLVLKKRT